MLDLASYACGPCSKEIVKQVLQDLLVYEGGEMQSMNEMISCSLQNERIISYAKKHGIELDLSQIGRKK